MKFSIIIPCYNCEATLSETLDSVTSQNYDSFEIILVNDGSRDNTERVIEEYIATHKFDIKYIKQENKGVSYTRNAGIEAANGDYIVFLDSDDLMAPGLLSTIAKAHNENDVDTVYCRRTYGTDNVLPISDVSENNAPCEQMIRDMMYRMGTFSFCCFAYKTETLKKEGIRFTEGARYGEDWEFALKYLSHCKNGIFLDGVGFYFRILGTSVSRTIVYEQTHAISSAERLLGYLKERNHPMYEEANLHIYIKAVFSVAHRFAAADKVEFLDRLKKEYDVKGNMKRLLASKSFKMKIKVMAFLYVISPKMFNVVCRILG